ncbi:MAG TPA: endonuclease/exonuclease/phosphatase family protein, partial [Anaerolinea sp.]|nr:endonuclease/exonuclease/phosphatase family protein [Anaerolinea sp.]
NFQEQIEVIRRLNPDLVGLQETDTARFAGGNTDLVSSFAEALGMYSYYGPRSVTGTFGIALLSRYPIRNPQTFFMYSLGEQTAAILAEIEVNGATYHVLVTHLGNGGPVIQQEQGLQRLQGVPNVIVMGDFNMMPEQPEYVAMVGPKDLYYGRTASAGSPLDALAAVRADPPVPGGCLGTGGLP